MGIFLRKLWVNVPRSYGPWKAVHRSVMNNLESYYGVDSNLLALAVNLSWPISDIVLDYSKNIYVGSVAGSSIEYQNNGLNFTGDGSTDRINLGSISSADQLSFYDSQACTIIADYHPLSGPGNTFPRLIDKSDGGGAANGWGIWARTNDTYEFSVNDNDILFPVSEGSTMYSRAVRGWTIKSGEQKFFTGGVLHTTGSETGSFSSATTNAAIGNWNHLTDREWYGSIYQILAFSAILSDNQIALLSDNPYQLWQPVPQKTIFLPAESGGLTIGVTGSLPAMAGVLTQKKSYHRSLEGSI